MGGSGFSSEPGNLAIDRYVLAQTGKRKPKVCFLPTASGDNDQYIRRFYDAFNTLNADTRHVALFRPPADDLESYILDCDVIYVGGGHTRNMLLLWKEHGIDVIARKAWARGKVLCGTSAGANCWFEESVTDSMGSVPAYYAGKFAAMQGLGFLKGSFCPHYSSEKNRRPEFHRLLKQGKIGNGWAADDGCALHYTGEKLHAIISSRKEARAYQLRRVGTRINEIKRSAKLLAR